MNTPPAMEHEPPTAPERRILEAVKCRGIADFTGFAEADREIRASFLEALIAGSRPELPELCCPLRIRGARIIGPIRSLPKVGTGVRPTLLFRECHFDCTLDFSGADFLTLRLIDCTLPAFIGTSLTTKSDLDLSGSHFSGVTEHDSDLAEVSDCAVHLNHAHIGGRLLMSSTPRSRFEAICSVRLDGARIDGNAELHGARLDACDRTALSARSTTFGGNIELLPFKDQSCEVTGEICLVAAHITGDLDCGAAHLSNPGGRVLHCEDFVVESVFLTAENDFPFRASGRLNFLTANIGGSLFLSNAYLSPGPDYSGPMSIGAGVAINLRQARISNALILSHVHALDPPDPTSISQDRPVQGWFMLTGARMNALVDDIDSGWPAHGYLDIDGAVYERIHPLAPGEPIEKRIAWLRKQFRDGRPDARSYRPQPYEQLTRALRDSGQSREADAIAVEKIRMRLAARVDRPWKRVFPRLLMLISNHGYSTSRAILSFLVFVAMGAVMYTLAVQRFDQPFHPFEQPPEPTTYVLPLGLGEKHVEAGCPGLDTPNYALDFALPLINLGQDNFCRFVPQGPFRWLWLALHSLFAVFGAGLSAVVVLTLTGLLKRD